MTYSVDMKHYFGEKVATMKKCKQKELELQDAVYANQKQFNITYACFDEDGDKMNNREKQKIMECIEGCVFSFYRQNKQSVVLYNTHKSNEINKTKVLTEYVNNYSDQYCIGYFLLGQIYHGNDESYDVSDIVFQYRAPRCKTIAGDRSDFIDDDELDEMVCATVRKKQKCQSSSSSFIVTAPNTFEENINSKMPKLVLLLSASFKTLD